MSHSGPNRPSRAPHYFGFFSKYCIEGRPKKIPYTKF